MILSIVDPVILYCDNNAVIAQEKKPRSHLKSKHVLRKYHIIREIIQRGDVAISRVATDDNVADPLTKGLPQRKHDTHARGLGLRDCSSWP